VPSLSLAVCPILGAPGEARPAEVRSSCGSDVASHGLRARGPAGDDVFRCEQLLAEDTDVRRGVDADADLAAPDLTNLDGDAEAGQDDALAGERVRTSMRGFLSDSGRRKKVATHR